MLSVFLPSFLRSSSVCADAMPIMHSVANAAAMVFMVASLMSRTHSATTAGFGPAELSFGVMLPQSARHDETDRRAFAHGTYLREGRIFTACASAGRSPSPHGGRQPGRLPASLTGT